MSNRRNWIAVVAAGIGIALVVALFSPLASSSLDGLERVAEDKGFLGAAKDSPYEIIPDYAFPGVDNEALSTILAGVVGVVIVAAMGLGIGLALRAVARRNGATSGGIDADRG